MTWQTHAITYYQLSKLLKNGLKKAKDKIAFIFGISYQCINLPFQISVNGGAMRDRTADLLRARQALSQLSYSPIYMQLRLISSIQS